MLQLTKSTKNSCDVLFQLIFLCKSFWCFIHHWIWLSCNNPFQWDTLVEQTALGEGYKDTCKTFRPALKKGPFTHLRSISLCRHVSSSWSVPYNLSLKNFSSSTRLNMFPDGGIARLRAYGVAVASLPESPHSLVDLSAATNGGVVFHQDDNDSEEWQRWGFNPDHDMWYMICHDIRRWKTLLVW